MAFPPLTEVQPIRGLDPADCDYYHRFEVPGLGETDGPWDLRAGAADYLGHAALDGKSVLEIGPASGFLSFWMEGQGATVTCLEPDLEHFWDLVPTARANLIAFHGDFRSHIARIRNSFWLAHERLDSRVKVVHGSAYSLPDDFGPFDVSVLSSVLLHTKLPVEIISRCAKVTRGTMIVTERHYPELGEQPVMRFEPEPGKDAVDTWWRFTPAIVTQMLGVWGFSHARVNVHRQPYYHDGKPYEIDLFTVIAARSADLLP
jgi:hypothetical protein